jgi:hypothetical protein
MCTKTGDYPENRGDQEVRKRAQHGHEELGLVIDTTPWFQSLDPGSSRWCQSDDLDVFVMSFLVVGVRCWCGYNDAFVG